MSGEDKKPAPPRAQLADKPLRTGEMDGAVGVALARFDHPVQYPGTQQDTQVKSGPNGTGGTWAVDYLPAMAHLRITYTAQGRTRVGYVPINHVLCWEPAS